MVIDCLESILSKDFNINILNELKNISGWRISPDEFIPEQGKLSEKFSDSGMLINSYNKNKAFHQTVKELRALTDKELNDIGINRGDIVSIARMDADMNPNLKGWV